MLICAACGTVVANVDPTTIRYGGCGACDLKDVIEGIKQQKEKQDGRP